MNNILNFEKYITESLSTLLDINGKQIKTSSFVKFEKDGVEYKGKVKSVGISNKDENNIKVEIIIPLSERGQIIEIDIDNVEVYM